MSVVYNTTIDQGADWFFTVTYADPNGTPINITDYTAAMQMRSIPQSPRAFLTLTTENGGIEIDGTAGVVNLHATSEQTMVIDEGAYVYDIEIYSPASPDVITTRLVQGQILVTAQVTR